jgi:hypothetical protein
MKFRIAIRVCLSEQPPRCRHAILVEDTQSVFAKRKHMMTILIVLAVLMLLGAIPAWPHSRSWGYGPSGGLGLIVLILLVLVLSGRL